MEKEILESINEKLAVLVILADKERFDGMNAEDKIACLYNLGANKDTIAFALNIKPKSVTEALSRLRKKGMITRG